MGARAARSASTATRSTPRRNAPEPLITAIEVTPGSEQDGPQAASLVDQQPEQHRPSRLVGDTAYGNGPVRAELHARDVEILAPVPEVPAPEGRLGKRDFQIDLKAGTVTCPAGQTVPIRSQRDGRRRALFRRAVCRECPLRMRCLAPRTTERSIWLTSEEELLQAARRAIERLLGLLACRYRARKSRYIGREKARLQAAWSAALVNLNPISHRLASQTA